MFLVGSAVCLSFLQFKKAEPVSSTTEDPRKIYTEKCASCHGEKVEAFVDRKWKHGTKREELIASITNGYSDFGMPAWDGVIPAKDIAAMADLIVESLKTVSQYDFTKEKKNSDGPAIFKSTGMTVVLDAIASGLNSPWGFEQLPDMTYLITDRNGTLYHVDKNKNKTAIKGTPEVVAEGQGGMLDITIHPKYAENGWVYIPILKARPLMVKNSLLLQW